MKTIRNVFTIDFFSFVSHRSFFILYFRCALFKVQQWLNIYAGTLLNNEKKKEKMKRYKFSLYVSELLKLFFLNGSTSRRLLKIERTGIWEGITDFTDVWWVSEREESQQRKKAMKRVPGRRPNNHFSLNSRWTKWDIPSDIIITASQTEMTFRLEFYRQNCTS